MSLPKLLFLRVQSSEFPGRFAEPGNSHAFLPIATGRIASSHLLLSGGPRSSSRYVTRAGLTYRTLRVTGN